MTDQKDKIQDLDIALMQKDIKQILKHAEYTNGKVAELVEWRLKMEGAKSTLKGLWGVMGVFAIAISFGLFGMYVEFQGLEGTIRDIVIGELENYEFEIIE